MKRVALITGAGRGIGKGCAIALAQRGFDLIANDRPGSPDLEETAEAIRLLGRSCEVLAFDVFSRDGCQSLVDEAVRRFGHIDALVSNPACSIRGNFLTYDPRDFERVVAGTLTAGFHLSQLVARHMVHRGSGGKIVFISSVQAELPIARSVAYNAAKSGLNQLARTIAVELFEHRINVNVIEPGWIDTPGERTAFDDETIARKAPQLPLGRLGTPDDVGRAAAFLVSDDADYITGSILTVDGGFRFKGWR